MVHQDRHHFGIVRPVTAGTQGRRQECVAIGEILGAGQVPDTG